jgi:hypothetical protein
MEEAELADAKAGVAHEQQGELEAAVGFAKALLQDPVDVGWDRAWQVEGQLGQVFSTEQVVGGGRELAVLVEPAEVAAHVLNGLQA